MNSFKAPVTFNATGTPRICAIDCGLKYNQVRCLARRGARVDLVPWNHPLDTTQFDGLFIRYYLITLQEYFLSPTPT